MIPGLSPRPCALPAFPGFALVVPFHTACLHSKKALIAALFALVSLHLPFTLILLSFLRFHLFSVLFLHYHFPFLFLSFCLR